MQCGSALRPESYNMSSPKSRKVLAVVDDLMFAVKIDAAARQSGVVVEYAKTHAEALEKAKELPLVVLLDLNHNKLDVLKLIKAFKKDEDLKKINLLGFISHVDGEKKQAAVDAGCDSVVPRSAFSVNLPQILKRHSTAL
jgi:CheY-like chemotaxis protein